MIDVIFHNSLDYSKNWCYLKGYFLPLMTKIVALKFILCVSSCYSSKMIPRIWTYGSYGWLSLIYMYIAGNDIMCCVYLILLAHSIYSMEHVWHTHQSVYITQTLGHMRIHYISFIKSTLHILRGGCHVHVTHTLHIFHRAYVAYTHWYKHHT